MLIQFRTTENFASIQINEIRRDKLRKIANSPGVASIHKKKMNGPEFIEMPYFRRFRIIFRLAGRQGLRQVI